MTKHCFVTVGATASFNALVAECLSDSVLRALQRHGYTHLLIQHGREPGAQEILRAFEARNADGWDTRANYGLDVEGYDLKDSLDDDMAMVKANQERNRHEGVIISHAGAGTVLTAMRLGLPVIVVPNASLMDNHQLELAEALARERYVIHGRLGLLDSAIAAVEPFRSELRRQPRNRGPDDSDGIGDGDRTATGAGTSGLASVMQQELALD